MAGLNPNEHLPGYRDFIRTFIRLYKEEPCLWKVKHPDYQHRLKKEKSYEKLVDFLKTVNPGATKETVCKKINNLRTSYRKELTRLRHHKEMGEPIEEYVPRLYYFHDFSFLKDQVEDQRMKNENSSYSSESMGDGSEHPFLAHCEVLETDSGEVSNDSVANDATPPNPWRAAVQGVAGSGQQPQREEIEEEARPSAQQQSRQYYSREAAPQAYQEDRYQIFGRMVAMKMRDLAKGQRILAERLFSEVFFFAEMNQLTMDHRVVRQPTSHPRPSVKMESDEVLQ